MVGGFSTASHAVTRRWFVNRAALATRTFVPLAADQELPAVIATPSALEPAGLETDGESMYLLFRGAIFRFRQHDLQQLASSGFSTSDMQPASTQSLPGRQLAFDGGFLWRAGNAVYRLAPSLGEEEEVYSGDLSKRVTFDGESLWIVHDTRVRKISRNGSVMLNLFRQGAGDVLWDGSSIWISLQQQGEVWRLDPSTGSDTARVQACPGAMPSLVYDGLSVWVACADDGSVLRITPDSNKASFTQTKYLAGGRPVQLEFDGVSVWAANEATGAFQRFSNNKEIVEETFTYPGAIKALLLRFGGTYLWGVVRTADKTVLLKF
jgi:hypothetical protein